MPAIPITKPRVILLTALLLLTNKTWAGPFEDAVSDQGRGDDAAALSGGIFLQRS